MDKRAWQATVHRAAMSQTRLKQLSIHTALSEVDIRPGDSYWCGERAA